MHEQHRAPAVELGEQQMKSTIADPAITNVGIDGEAADAKRVGRVGELREARIDVRQRQHGEAREPPRMVGHRRAAPSLIARASAARCAVVPTVVGTNLDSIAVRTPARSMSSRSAASDQWVGGTMAGEPSALCADSKNAR